MAIGLIIDTETTGLLKPDVSKPGVQPEMIEFAGIKVNSTGTVKAKYSTLIKPKRGIPIFITKITSISDADVKDAPIVRVRTCECACE